MLHINPLHIHKNQFWSAIIKLLPFILILFGTTFQNNIPSLSSSLRIIGLLYMVLYVLIARKTNPVLNIFFIVFLPFFIYGLYANPYNYKAALEDGLRYLFPIIVLYYGYTLKNDFVLLFRFLIFFILINLVVQFYIYYNFARGVSQWFYYVSEDGSTYHNGYRATGLVVLFALYAFMNAIGFILIKFLYKGRYKNLFLLVCLFGVIASYSFKTYISFAVVLLFIYYKQIHKVLLGSITGLLVLVVFFYQAFIQFVNDGLLRLRLYILDGNSARADSYRIMWEEIKDFNLFGKGIGVFGGPASTKYNSPYYFDKKFNWYDAEWLNLPTTDTYLPHPIVELGIIGGVIYLLTIMSPLFGFRYSKQWLCVFLIYFMLFFDMLFTFSLNNLEYLMLSLVFVYPILCYRGLNKQDIFVQATL